MREVIPLLQLVEDLKVSYKVITVPPTITYKVFEDNQSYIAIAEFKKPSVRTNHTII